MPTAQRAMLDQYCVTCHNQQLKTAGLMLDKADLNDIPGGAETWEKVVMKLRSGMMPPLGRQWAGGSGAAVLCSLLPDHLHVWSVFKRAAQALVGFDGGAPHGDQFHDCTSTPALEQIGCHE